MTDERIDPGGQPLQVPDSFAALVRDAFTHLYDYAYLQRHPLARLAGDYDSAPSRAKALRNLLLDALEQINPGDSVSRNDREWRPYGILAQRYVDGFSVVEIMQDMHISLRQFQRDVRKGLLAVASILWPQWQLLDRGVDAPRPPVNGEDLRQEMRCLGLALERIDLSLLVEDIVGTAEALAKASGLWLVSDSPGIPVLAQADLTLAKQALLGAISALIRDDAEGIRIVWLEAGGQACIELTVEPPLSIDEAGETGTRSLSTVATLMEAQGGSVKTTAGFGDRLGGLRLCFPRLQGAHILLVDDNERVLQLFQRYLVAEGYAVTVADNAQRALEVAGNEMPDAVILDVMMRDTDGWQLLQQLRTNPRLKDVPIVICTVLNEPELAQALGADCYLKKPVSQEQMLAALRAALAGCNREPPHPAGP